MKKKKNKLCETNSQNFIYDGSDGSELVTHWVTEWLLADLTDVTLVSE